MGSWGSVSRLRRRFTVRLRRMGCGRRNGGRTFEAGGVEHGGWFDGFGFVGGRHPAFHLLDEADVFPWSQFGPFAPPGCSWSRSFQRSSSPTRPAFFSVGLVAGRWIGVRSTSRHGVASWKRWTLMTGCASRQTWARAFRCHSVCPPRKAAAGSISLMSLKPRPFTLTVRFRSLPLLSLLSVSQVQFDRASGRTAS